MFSVILLFVSDCVSVTYILFMYVLRYIYYAFVNYFTLKSVFFLRFVLTKDKNTNFFPKMFGGY